MGLVGNMFSTTSGKLKKLVDAGRYDDAAQFYADHRKDLDPKDKEVAPLLARVAGALNARLDPRMSRLAKTLAADDPAAATPQHWPQVAKEAADAKALLLDRHDVVLLQLPAYRSKEQGKLGQALSGLRQRYEAYAPTALARVALTYKDNFFVDYPWGAAMDGEAVMAAAFPTLRAALERSSSSGLRAFLAQYDDVLPEAARDEITRITLAAMLRERAPDGPPTVLQSIELLKSYSKITSDPKDLPFRAILALVGGSSADSIETDLPVASRTVAPATIAALARTQDFVYVVDVVRAAPARRVVAVEPASSRYVASRSPVQNPRYAEAMQAYQNARAQYQQAESDDAQTQSQVQDNANSGVGNLWGGFGAVVNAGLGAASTVAVQKARERMEALRQVVAGTPATVMQDNYGAYSYRVTTLQVTKPVKILIYALSPRTRRFLSQSVDATESAEFHLVSGLNPSDPDRKTILANADSTDKVAQFARKTPHKQLSGLLDQLEVAQEQSLAPRASNVVRDLRANASGFLRQAAAQRSAIAAAGPPPQPPQAQAPLPPATGMSTAAPAAASAGGAAAISPSAGSGCGANGMSRAQLIAKYDGLARQARANSRTGNANARNMGSSGFTRDLTGAARGRNDQRGYQEQAADIYAKMSAYASCVSSALRAGSNICPAQQSCKSVAGL